MYSGAGGKRQNLYVGLGGGGGGGFTVYCITGNIDIILVQFLCRILFWGTLLGRTACMCT